VNIPIRLGSIGGAVMMLQERLTVHGFKTHTTGFADRPTMDAVARFQKARRIHEDGVVASETWRALEADPEPKKPRPKVKEAD